jgi:hypothetical protein
MKEKDKKLGQDTISRSNSWNRREKAERLLGSVHSRNEKGITTQPTLQKKTFAVRTIP